MRRAWIEISWDIKAFLIWRSLPMRGAWIEILWYNMVNEIAESYPLVRSRLPQNLKFEESRPKAVWGAFFIAQFYLLDMIVAIKIPKEIMSVNAS